MVTSKPVGTDLGLSNDEKTELLRIAKDTIENEVSGKPGKAAQPNSAKLMESRGAFVSLYKRGMLRGCIGALQSDQPLYKNVEEMSLAAAFRDPRFAPVRAEEVGDLDIEISVLTPFELITDPESVQVGLHGILIRQGFRSGLLLPQVATERNWDRITFLEETCRKAGLPKDAWKEKETQIYVFSADVFS